MARKHPIDKLLDCRTQRRADIEHERCSGITLKRSQIRGPNSRNSLTDWWTRVELSAACHDMIIAEVPINVSLALQLIGRLVRVGQKKVVTVEILTIHDSFDTVRQGTIAKKGVNVLGANIDFSLDNISGNNNERASDQSQMTWICEEVLRRQLGQACSRLLWTVKTKPTLTYIKTLSDQSTTDEQMDEIDQVEAKKLENYRKQCNRFQGINSKLAPSIMRFEQQRRDSKCSISMDTTVPLTYL